MVALLGIGTVSFMCILFQHFFTTLLQHVVVEVKTISVEITSHDVTFPLFIIIALSLSNLHLCSSNTQYDTISHTKAC